MAGGFPYKLPFTLGFVVEAEPEATAWELALSLGGWRRDPGNSGWMQPGTGRWRQHGDTSGFV